MRSPKSLRPTEAPVSRRRHHTWQIKISHITGGESYDVISHGRIYLIFFQFASQSWHFRIYKPTVPACAAHAFGFFFLFLSFLLQWDDGAALQMCAPLVSISRLIVLSVSESAETTDASPWEPHIDLLLAGLFFFSPLVVTCWVMSSQCNLTLSSAFSSSQPFTPSCIIDDLVEIEQTQRAEN